MADASETTGRRSWAPSSEWTNLSDLGLLVVRVVVRFELFAHGMQKFGQFGGTVDFQGKHVTGSAAVDAQAAFLDLLGYHPTTALSWFLTFTEVTAGILLMAGLLTPLAAAAVIGDMFQRP